MVGWNNEKQRNPFQAKLIIAVTLPVHVVIHHHYLEVPALLHNLLCWLMT
jgi:hypothetical protein